MQMSFASRRDVLKSTVAGFGYLAFAGLSTMANERANPLAPRRTHFSARAKHVIFLCMEGAPSHVDTFDYKPKLAERAGQSMPRARTFARLMASPYRFRQHGQSGLWISEGNSGYWIFAGLLDNVIYKVTPQKQVSVFMEKAGYTGSDPEHVGTQTRSGRSHVLLIGPSCTGMDSQGRVIWCADNDRQVKRLEKDGTQTVLSSGNVVFSAKGEERTVQKKAVAAMEAHMDRSFVTFVRTIEALQALLDEDPFQAFRLKPGAKRIVTFLMDEPKAVPKLPLEYDGARILAAGGRSPGLVNAPRCAGGAG